MFGFFLILSIENGFQMMKEREVRRAAAAAAAVAEPDEASPLLGGSSDSGRRLTRGDSNSSSAGHRSNTSDEEQPSYQNDTSSRRHNHEDQLRDDQGEREQSQESDHHGHSHSPVDLLTHSSFRSYLLLIALSFHSLFEGLAIGLQVKKAHTILRGMPKLLKNNSVLLLREHIIQNDPYLSLKLSLTIKNSFSSLCFGRRTLAPCSACS